MKKILVILILLFCIVLFSMYAIKLNNEISINSLHKYNSQFENYLKKNINGTELATLINKAINENEKNNIEKNKNNHYIENDENSIKIEIKMIVTNKTYPMEEIYNNDTAEFIRFFNMEEFKCVKTEYHEKTGKIGKIVFEQVEKDK